MLAGSSCVAGDEPAAREPVTVAPPQALAEEELEEPEEVRDGAWLYERNCSGCHGMTGAGDGPTAVSLGVKARSFAEGGFSFGNTREAILRTLRSGFPGRSIMPPFEGVLSDEELGLVIDHLFTLMPPREEEDTRASVMTVGSRPVIARGKLPPIAEGLPEHPRGLLIGLPEGLTFEYDIKDVKLLAVRLGDFADREDWRSRGGGYLRPLGAPICVVKPKELDTPFVVPGFDSATILRGRLLSTSIGLSQVTLEYELADDSMEQMVRVRETCRYIATSSGPAFSRRLELKSISEDGYVSAQLAGSADTNYVQKGFDSMPEWWRPPVVADRLPWIDGATPLAKEGTWTFPWFVATHEDGVMECVLVRLIEPLVLHGPSQGFGKATDHHEFDFLGTREFGLRANLYVSAESACTIQVITVLSSNVSPSALSHLAAEVLD